MLCGFIDKLMMDYTWSTYICTSPTATGMLNRLYKHIFIVRSWKFKTTRNHYSFINSEVHSENLNYIL